MTERGRRAQALRNLALIFAAPVLAMSGLFAWGVHLGERHRDAVIAFERDYLHWEPPAIAPEAVHPEDPPKPPASTPAPPQHKPAPVATTPESDRADVQVAAGEHATPDAGGPSTAAAIDRAVSEALAQEPAPGAATAPPGHGTLDAPAARALAVPVSLRVKVLVDDRLAASSHDWIATVVQTIGAASQVYRDHFGIDLALAGVVRWSGGLAGLGGAALHQRLREHPREGADIVLGMVDVALGPADYALGAPDEAAPLNGAYALVGRTRAGAELPHLHGTLRALGHLLGAKRVAPGSEDDKLGSFMGDAPLPDGRTPWIDLDNRERILARKTRPFQPEGKR